jgi:hypothetical protein
VIAGESTGGKSGADRVVATHLPDRKHIEFIAVARWTSLSEQRIVLSAPVEQTNRGAVAPVVP